jgi:hypothetical protein
MRVSFWAGAGERGTRIWLVAGAEDRSADVRDWIGKDAGLGAGFGTISQQATTAPPTHNAPTTQRFIIGLQPPPDPNPVLVLLKQA